MSRRAYRLIVTINGARIKKLVIDPHYEKKHMQSINDELIIKLVYQLNGQDFEPDRVGLTGFEYYKEDNMKLEGKLYKLIWVFDRKKTFMGIVNCYRR